MGRRRRLAMMRHGDDMMIGEVDTTTMRRRWDGGHGEDVAKMRRR